MAFAFPESGEIVRKTRRIPGMKGCFTCFAAVLTCVLLVPGNASAADKLLQSSDLTYLGSFRVPTGTFGTTSFDYGGEPLAYYAAHNSLFIMGNITAGFNVAEISIPALKTGGISSLNTASVLQNFVDPTGGKSGSVKAGGACCVANGVQPGNILVVGNKLVGASYTFYDANNEAVMSHYTKGLTLSTRDSAGLYQLSGAPDAGYVSGWMTDVPADYQAALGGTHLVGNGSLNIIGRTSWGLSAFSTNLANLGSVVPLPVTPLFYYNSAHPLIGQWNGGSGTYQTTWNGTGIIRGMAFPAGSKTILYIGKIGTGAFCYGEAAACGDPCNSDKGNHAYPYTDRVWAYNADDLAAVKSGSKQPWEVVPYATWSLSSPYQSSCSSDLGAGGVAYDSSTKKLYVSQAKVDTTFMYHSGPIVNVYSVNVDTPTATHVPETPSILGVN